MSLGFNFLAKIFLFNRKFIFIDYLNDSFVFYNNLLIYNLLIEITYFVYNIYI